MLIVLFLYVVSPVSALSWKIPPKTIEHKSLKPDIYAPTFPSAVIDDARRQALCFLGSSASIALARPALSVEKIPTSLSDLLPLVKDARSQLEKCPDLIKAEKWDSVRAILITPPISDCWSKSSKLLLNFATAIGEEIPDGDELAALEGREEAVSHLRYLDMAVYNNIFNPISSEGTNGATKELIRSYYDDPMNEFKASINALDGILALTATTK
mmetsp:Transcript_15707/g.31308  ORF Transcript_15707/g.31308 Transcript_15707/m.31308 type:complete len:214 (-) Transcript_15707:86-727(-)